MTATGDTHARSLPRRIFGLLDIVGASPRPLTLSEIARGAGLPVSTAHRLLSELLHCGVLVRTATGRYELGERIWRLGVAAPWERELRRAAAAHLHDLARRTGSAVALATLSGERLVCLDTVAAPGDGLALAGAGEELPVTATSAGKLLLATTARDRLGAVLNKRLPRLTPHTLVAPRLLMTQLERARRHGYATAHEEAVIGQASLSVGVPTGPHRLPMALTVLTPAPHHDLTRMLPPLRAVAAAMSAAVTVPRPQE
ncbi:IclR family transcriptional regulator [Streptomyces sp. NPDC048448]|uniref:IclR family transcriptional regulator n=2 Tax=Streptomyces TaxID=1883 RepID=A0ABW3X7G6_9ACTN|nr:MULTISPECIES: IclR family transcriptional regulator C-terminal domain-containing protein [unclassified Streptomyces]QIY61391.1 helix-turn-helix domain-containing protein [Streptomyces sp. RPA4-2]